MFGTDPIVINYINILRELMKKKKSTMKIVDGKPTMCFDDDPVEIQVRADFNTYIKKNYPDMAYVKDARVRIKHIPDDCGLENKGIILKAENKYALVKLDNDKQAEYPISNLELL